MARLPGIPPAQGILFCQHSTLVRCLLCVYFASVVVVKKSSSSLHPRSCSHLVRRAQLIVPPTGVPSTPPEE